MVDPRIALLTFGLVATVVLVLFWPVRGLAWRIRGAVRRSERVLLEDALKHAYMCERQGRPCTLDSLAGRLEITRGRVADLVAALARTGAVHLDRSELELTDEGRSAALRLVRSHRLWERYLADRTGVPAGEWHDEAERMEHTLSREEADALAARLGHPAWDPHGDPIPSASGELPPLRTLNLSGAEPGTAVEVVHLEDEPRELFDRLVKDGLAPGARLAVVDRTPEEVTVRGSGRERTLDRLTARNITIRVLPEGEEEDPGGRTLADVPLGETVRVTALSPRCQGMQRRRLLDLGVVPGARITPELVSAAGDPVAYRIRGALIGLRAEQARWIRVAEPEEARTPGSPEPGSPPATRPEEVA